MFKMKNLILVSLFLLVLTGISYADYRYYAWTYQFDTMIAGETEIEFYTTLKQSDRNDDTTAKWARQIEIETGLTDRWDISMYLADKYSEKNAKTKFSEVKFRTRYKLTSMKDMFFFDPLIYIEYRIQADRSYPDKWETKLVLAKDIDKLNIALNFIPEETYKEDSKEKKWKYEYAAGVSYAVVPRFRFGVESKGDLSNGKYMIGPAFSFANNSLWMSISPIYGVNRKSDDIRIQAIVGIAI
ncbi:MAG: hypothetical protein GY817_02205 [bacterium]|nr:hypothetical protein [bacterium]